MSIARHRYDIWGRLGISFNLLLYPYSPLMLRSCINRWYRIICIVLCTWLYNYEQLVGTAGLITVVIPSSCHTSLAFRHVHTPCMPLAAPPTTYHHSLLARTEPVWSIPSFPWTSCIWHSYWHLNMHVGRDVCMIVARGCGSEHVQCVGPVHSYLQLAMFYICGCWVRCHRYGID